MAMKLVAIPLMTIAVLCVVQVHQVSGGATMEQMISSLKLMRDVCQPKFPKITNEIADGMKVGKIPDDMDSKCYVNCLLEMMQTMRKGKVLYESTLKQVDLMMPEELKDDYRRGLEACKNVVNGIKNNCDAGYAFVLCLFKNLDRFMFP